MFGVNRASRTLYRRIGNTIGQSRRQRLDASYMDRGNWLLQNVRRLGVADLPQPRLLELGTGRKNFYSLYLRLFFDFRGTLYDVWDNRQLHALKRIFSQLGEILDMPPGAASSTRNIRKLSLIERAEHFEELYRAFDLHYIYPHRLARDAAGRVLRRGFQHGRSRAREGRSPRVLARGVFAGPQAGRLLDPPDRRRRSPRPRSSDLIAQAVSRLSRCEWRLFFQNEVQYFNRVSYDEFVALFAQAGFEAVSVEVLREAAALQSITISAQHRGQSAESLEATRLYMIHRKPL